MAGDKFLKRIIRAHIQRLREIVVAKEEGREPVLEGRPSASDLIAEFGGWLDNNIMDALVAVGSGKSRKDACRLFLEATDLVSREYVGDADSKDMVDTVHTSRWMSDVTIDAYDAIWDVFDELGIGKDLK